MLSQLEQLKAITTVVADTGDIAEIKKFSPVDATTNPSLLLQASTLPAYVPLLNEAKSWAITQGGSNGQMLENTTYKMAVLIGLEILNIIPGRISTEVNAKLSFDTQATLHNAHQIIDLYNQAGIGNERVLIKIAATWQGIQAAKILEKEGINCNLTLLFSFTQAAACADAGAYLISPFVGRILDWYKKSDPNKDFSGANDPGVQSVTNLYNFYKTNNYETIVMGASFRNISQIQQLAGCDRLTINPTLMRELDQLIAPLSPKLTADNATSDRTPLNINQALFQKELTADAMTNENLSTGIKGFITDQIKLEQRLVEW